ncbi:MAG: rod-binding protein [Candidatus Eremiobacteraeota bacterium]|nr:rod-binding protein [Candidatus Eremiobacteraeota bacterium]
MDVSATTNAQPLTPAQQKALDGLHKVTQQFEGIFIGMLLREMRKGESDQTLFGDKSSGEKIFGEMLDDQRAQDLAKTGSFGLARVLEQQLKASVLANADRESAVPVPTLTPGGP